MSDIDPATNDRITELEARVTTLESPNLEFPNPQAISVEARIRNLETLLAMVVADCMGQVSLRGETLAEVAAMNRRALGNVVDEVVQETEIPLEEASRRNLLEFAKELKIPETATVTTRKSYKVLINGEEHLIENVSPNELSRQVVELAPEGGHFEINPVD